MPKILEHLKKMIIAEKEIERKGKESIERMKRTDQEISKTAEQAKTEKD